MERFNYILKVKKQQKELAKQIRKLKVQRKLKNRNGRSLWSIESELFKLKYEYRHQHIAYCIICGRERYEIENPRPGNEPNERYLDALLGEYEQALRTSTD